MDEKIGKNRLLIKFEKLELHHKILVFILIMILTILFTRFYVFIHNPNPIFFNFELHHFDYGILLLLLTALMLLFGTKKYNIYLLLAAVAIGLIIDDYWFIRENVIENDLIQTKVYNSTFPSVLIFLIITILLIFFINSLRKNKFKL